jgi:hypothetical protein
MLLASESIATFCSKTAGLLQYVGYALTIFKIAIPLIIIIFGMMDFGKAVVSEKDEDVKKQAVKLMRRAIAGIIIFFIPTFVIWIFETINDYSENEGQFNTCKQCLLHPSQCEVSE